MPQRHRVQLALRARHCAASSARMVAAARRWLDLDAAPQAIDAALADLPGAPGLRLPGSLDAFELAVRAVLGQQVTVAAARTLARRVVERFGDAAGHAVADARARVPGAAGAGGGNARAASPSWASSAPRRTRSIAHGAGLARLAAQLRARRRPTT